CYAQCKKILTENRSLLDLIAETLIEEETLTSEQIHNLVQYGSITAPETKQESVKEESVEKVNEETSTISAIDEEVKETLDDTKN
ncbi:MAG: cell division protein FtsH, partial [Erysipelotrichia bacterium]|nr:cell division protein FtsH [Erysipelotrichia bacterium]